MAIHHLEVAKTPVAVIDFETTGLNPGPDRVVEVSVVRIEPGRKPELVFDTLVNPERQMAATEIHGITDAAVRNAPSFGEIIRPLTAAISGCVVAAYNAYFDMKFWRAEARAAGGPTNLPFVCLMYLRPMLGLGSRCRLAEACRAHGISLVNAHRTAADSMAAALLFPVCLDAMSRAGVRTYGDLASGRGYAFCESFAHPLLVASGRQGAERVWTREHAAAARHIAPDSTRRSVAAANGLSRHPPTRPVTTPASSLLRKGFREWLRRLLT